MPMNERDARLVLYMLSEMMVGKWFDLTTVDDAVEIAGMEAMDRRFKVRFRQFHMKEWINIPEWGRHEIVTLLSELFGFEVNNKALLTK